MQEGEKFIRQILPGLMFLIFSGFQIYSFMPNEIFSFLTEMETSTAIIGVIVLGGVGYIFSNTYFVVTYLMGYTVSHREFIQRLIKENTIVLYINGQKLNKSEKNEISDEQAWSIINTIWYVTLKKDEMERVTVPISRLSHLLHGIGISFVALVVSLILSFILFLIFGCNCSIFNYGITMTLSLLFLALLAYNYYITKKKYYSFVNSSVETAINEFKLNPEKSNGENQNIDNTEGDKMKKVIIYYSK